MARFRALPAAEEPDPEHLPDPAPAVRPEARHVLPPFHPDIDAQRYGRLDGIGIRGFDSRFAELAVESAKRLCCRAPGWTDKTDRAHVSSVARYLAAEAQRVDDFNYSTALRRANVDCYLLAKSTEWTPKSTKFIRSLLYQTGRLVHPREFPAPRALETAAQARTTAASPEEVGRLYAVAHALPTVHCQRLLVVLDLCYGAGARPVDLKTLRGCNVERTTWQGEPMALLPLANQAGGSRIVPVADPDASRRLLALASAHPEAHLMTVGGGRIGRNTANKVSEYLTRRGHRGLNAAALRHGWILKLAQSVPAALLMQLADVKDLRVLADQKHHLPAYGVEHTITWLKESYQ